MSALSSPVEPSTTSASVLSDGPRFRRVVAGVSLVLSPVFLLAAFVVVPTMASDTRAMLAAIAQHPTQWYLFGLFLLVSYVLLAPAVLGLMHLLRDRAAAWSGIGGSLAFLGTFAAVADTRLVFVHWQMAAPEADRGQMVALLTRLEAAAGATLPFILGTLGLVIGTVLLAIGLYRARAVPTWVAAALGLASSPTWLPLSPAAALGSSPAPPSSSWPTDRSDFCSFASPTRTGSTVQGPPHPRSDPADRSVPTPAKGTLSPGRVPYHESGPNVWWTRTRPAVIQT
jgi:hypothetical protein